MSIVEDTLNPNCVFLQVRMYSRALAIIGGFLVLASGAGEVYRQKPRSRSLQSTGQVFLGVYLICMVRLVSVLWIFPWHHNTNTDPVTGFIYYLPEAVVQTIICSFFFLIYHNKPESVVIGVNTKHLNEFSQLQSYIKLNPWQKDAMT